MTSIKSDIIEITFKTITTKPFDFKLNTKYEPPCQNNIN